MGHKKHAVRFAGTAISAILILLISRPASAAERSAVAGNEAPKAPPKAAPVFSITGFDPKDFSKMCLEVHERSLKPDFAEKIWNTVVTDFSSPLPQNKMWLAAAGNFFVALPSGKYDVSPHSESAGGFTISVTGHNGAHLSLFGAPLRHESEKVFLDLFKKPMTTLDYHLLAYQTVPEDLKCGKSTKEKLRTMVALMVKESDLKAMAMTFDSLDVHLVKWPNARGLLRVAKGADEKKHNTYRLVLEMEDDKWSFIVQASTANENQLRVLAMDLYYAPDLATHAMSAPDWVKRLETDLKTSLTGAPRPSPSPSPSPGASP